MTDDSPNAVVDQLCHLLAQATDATKPVMPRIATAVAAGAYHDTLLRLLVSQARDKGHTWEELADIFVTSPMGVKSRFDTYRSYEGEEIEDD